MVTLKFMLIFRYGNNNMKYALLDKNNYVIQIDCSPREGFLEVDDYVVCGMKKYYSKFINPNTNVKSPILKIEELEAAQTPRLLREAVLGNLEAIEKITAIESKIKELRGEL